MSLRELAREASDRRGRKLTPGEARRLRRRGYDAERELVERLRRAGLKAIRIPVSSPSRAPLPDVFATKGDVMMAFEVKARRRKAYFKKAQVEKLFRFLEMHEAYGRRYAVLAAKFPRVGWFFKVVEESGDYSIQPGEGYTLPELVNACVRGLSRGRRT